MNVKERSTVIGDDIYFKFEDIDVIGSQIQMIDIDLGENQKELGKIKYGYGNNGKDKKEGAIYKNLFFTNTLGPVLVINPEFTEFLLKKASKINEKDVKYNKEDFEIEEKSIKSHKEFLDIKMNKTAEEQQKIFKFK